MKTWFASMPLFTKGTFVLMTSVFLIDVLLGWNTIPYLCLQPRWVVEHFQVYRIVTASVVHIGLLHVAFNMLAFVPIGSSLERILGTVQFTHLTLLIIFLESCLYILAAYALVLLHIYPTVLHECAIGFSGTIFGLIVVDNAQSSASHRSILGLFTVPAPLYPWALLLFWQLLLPGASFLGHAAGVLVGQMWVWDWLACLQLPRSTVAWIESSALCMRYLVPSPSFVMMPGPVLPYNTSEAAGHRTGSGSQPGSSVRWGLPAFLRWGWPGWGAAAPTVGSASQAVGGTSGSGGGGAVRGSSDGESGLTTPLLRTSHGNEARATFHGPARQVGGGTTGPSSTTGPSITNHARLLAAAAAEARMQRTVQPSSPSTDQHEVV